MQAIKLAKIDFFMGDNLLFYISFIVFLKHLKWMKNHEYVEIAQNRRRIC